MSHSGKIGCAALLVIQAVGCVSSTEPRIEATPSVGVATGATPAVTTTGASTGGEDPDISVVVPETGAMTTLVTASGSQVDAEISPDGERVVYERLAPGSPPQIFILDADGTTQRLTGMKGGAFDPTWSPDGTRIAFAGTRLGGVAPRRDSDIFVMSAAGGPIRRLVGTAQNDAHPDWSPDGTSVAFHSRYGRARGVPGGLIWVASIGARTPTQLTLRHTRYAGVDPVWSPDGRWIAFNRLDRVTILVGSQGEKRSRLWLVRPDGTHMHPVGTRIAKRAARVAAVDNPSWSPDGRSIVVEAGGSVGAGGRVGIVDVESGRIRILMTAPDAEPSWGPDGIAMSVVIDDAAAKPQSPVRPVWTPSWTRPDATVVLTGSNCELDGEAGVLRPGVLTIEFVNQSYREAYIKVMPLRHGRRLSDLRLGPFFAGGWGERNASLATDVWSSPRAVASGRWAIACFKDLIDGSNGFQIVPAGVAGPIEIG